MRTTPGEPEAAPTRLKPPAAKEPDIASVPVADTLAALQVDPETGLTLAEVDARRKEHGYNEVAEKRGTRSSRSSASSGACRRGCSS